MRPRRHARRTVTLIALAAGLLMIAAAWIPSYWWSLGFQDHGQRYEWFVVHGHLYVNTFAPNYVAAQIIPVLGWNPGFNLYRAAIYTLAPSSLPRFYRWAGHWHLDLPLYLPFLALIASLAAFCLYALLPNPRQRWRRKRGLCVSCGYDLTGNVSGVCPECGTEV